MCEGRGVKKIYFYIHKYKAQDLAKKMGKLPFILIDHITAKIINYTQILFSSSFILRISLGDSSVRLVGNLHMNSSKINKKKYNFLDFCFEWVAHNPCNQLRKMSEAKFITSYLKEKFLV